jgi:hypothetical protein
MHRLFGRYPEALARTLQIVDRCRFSLDELAYQYPEERDDPALTPQETLAKLTWEGAAERYPEGVPDSVTARAPHELRLIEKLKYAPYFLTVNSSSASPARRTFYARAAARPLTRPSAMCLASPRSTRAATTSCSSAS